MDNQRLFLFVALSFVVLLMWQAWLKDYGPAQQESHPTAPAVQQPATATAPEEELP